MSKVKEVYRFVWGTNNWEAAVGAMRCLVNGGIPSSVQSMCGGKPPVWTGAVTGKV